jgi:restriction system protein
LLRESRRLYYQWKKDQPEQDDEDEDETVESTTLEEAEETAWTEIQECLTEMNPYDFQTLVAGLLRAMGYHVSWVAPPGPDQGTDIIAHTDPLGVKGPRIRVQVKRRADRQSVDAVRSFLAVLGEGDIGLFVNTGGFTKDAENEVRGQERRRVMLVDLKRLFDLWVEHYDKVPESARWLLPLRPVYYLEPTE